MLTEILAPFASVPIVSLLGLVVACVVGCTGTGSDLTHDDAGSDGGGD